MIALAFLVALLSPQPEAAPSIDVLYQGTRQALPADSLDSLATMVGDLAIGSGYAARASSVPSSADLVVVVRYSPPLQITLRTPAPVLFYADRVSLYNDEDLEDGWPLLLASSADVSWSLVKYEGGLVLDLLCSDELEPLASQTVTSNCQVAPSRRRGRGGSPDAGGPDRALLPRKRAPRRS